MDLKIKFNLLLESVLSEINQYHPHTYKYEINVCVCPSEDVEVNL
jgi:hypothetical protein